MAEMTPTNPFLHPAISLALGFTQADGQTAPHIGLVGDTKSAMTGRRLMKHAARQLRS